MTQGIATIGTVLKMGESRNALSKVCPIKSYPMLSGVPEALQTTTLIDTDHTTISGVQSTELITFTANYDKEAYETLHSTEGQLLAYQLEWGTDGSDGIFSWNGTHSVSVSEAGVNEVREMVISCNATTTILVETSRNRLVNNRGAEIITSDGNPIETVEYAEV